MTPKLYILMGIPGCGKSTWARNFFRDYQIVSSDGIRAEKFPGPYDQTKNEEVFAEFHRRIDHSLLKGSAVVADATSLSSFARQKLIDIANQHGAEKHAVFFNNIGQALLRNAGRNRDPEVYDWVNYEAMEWMVKKFHDTKAAIIDEDYTTITSIEGTYEPDTRTNDPEPDPQDAAVST